MNYTTDVKEKLNECFITKKVILNFWLLKRSITKYEIIHIFWIKETNILDTETILKVSY